MCFTDLVEPCLVQEVVSVINGQGEITCRQSYTWKSLKSPGWFVHTTCTAIYHCVNVSPCLFLPSNTPWDRWLVSGISGKYFPCPLQYFFLWLYMTVYALTNVQKIWLHCGKSKAVESDGPHLNPSSATQSVVHWPAAAALLGSLRMQTQSHARVPNQNWCFYKILKWLVCLLQLKKPWD